MYHDIIIIGAGVVGCAIARELSRYETRICVLEREEDICCGASKANSAIIHAGYDALPGSRKAKFNVLGNQMMPRLAAELDIPFRQTGSLVVRTKDQPETLLEELWERGQKNGVPKLRILGQEELRRLEPNLAPDVVSALYAPTAAIVCPFHMTIAYAENACANGVDFHLNTTVERIEKTMHGYDIHTDQGIFSARVIINAAGVYADHFHNMVSADKLHITARRGEYQLFDKIAGNHVSHTIFQLPGKMGKGTLVTPTVHGNLLVGPTAEDTDNKEGTNTTMDGLSSLEARASLSVVNLPMRQVITSFAGLRAHEDSGDFIIGEVSDAPGFIDAAGIESPGLSSAPAIGAEAAGLAAEILSLQKKQDFVSTRTGICRPSELSMEQRNALIQKQPAYGNIVCRCEMVSEGEIMDAIHRPLGARSLDGVKRRVRAGMGRCQGGFCSPRVMEILAREVPMDLLAVTKSGGQSGIVCGCNKELSEVLYGEL